MKPSVTIFCLPFAGGSSAIYSEWNKLSGFSANFVPIELPGRGIKMNQTLTADINALAELLAAEIVEKIDGDYFVLGCSMGALLSYEVVRRIAKLSVKQPQGLIVAAQKAPTILSQPPLICECDNESLIEFIKDLGGVPESILRHEHTLNYFLPIIRSDLELVERYRPKSVEVLTIPILAFYSKSDSLYQPQSVEAWSDFTADRFVFQEVAGGHFFIKENTQAFFQKLFPELN